MDEWNKKFLKELAEERQSYREMIEFCCDDLIMNNYLFEQLTKKDYYFDLYCGKDYYTDEDGNEYYEDIFQYFIIDEAGAERFKTYTNEIVFYCDELDLYVLGVTHCGTSWECVGANWKDPETEANDEQ